MCKWILTCLIALISSVSFALPVRNPDESDILHEGLVLRAERLPVSVRFGYESDFVFNRHLEADAPLHRKLEHTEVYRNAGYLALNFCDRLDFFTTLGGSHVHFYGNALSFSPSPNFSNGIRLEIETHTNFAWSVGLRGLLWEYKCFALGVEGEYFFTSPRVNSIVAEANISNYPEDVHLKYREWQVGGGLCYRMLPCFEPYIAVKWSNARLSFDDFLSTFTGRPLDEFVILNNLENTRSVGYAIGGSFNVCDTLLFTVEWRFKDERALFVNGQMRF